VTGNIPPVIRPEHVSPRSLDLMVSELGLRSIGNLRGVEVSGLTVMTREVTAGDIFVAVRGANRHGAEFADDARANGAVAISRTMTVQLIAAECGLPIVVVDSPRASLGAIARWIYRTDDDAPQYFGITGTNGKTSTSYLLDGILRQMGITTGLSTTAERHIAGENFVSRFNDTRGQ